MTQRTAPALRQASDQAGFSALEAIVAVALLSIALLPLLDLQGQAIRTVDAVERAERNIITRQAVLGGLDPVMRVRPSEMSPPPGWRLENERVLETRRIRGAGGNEGRFQIDLVEVSYLPDNPALAQAQPLRVRLLVATPVIAFSP